MIPIGGFVPFSTIDFPGVLSCVIFCQGCPWRCDYCHNPHLQTFSQETSKRWEEVYDFLQKRKGLLAGVVFSGGEPSLHLGLPDAIRQAKDLGYKIGLHTAGMQPDRLEKVLPLVDWVGMDIKAPFLKYHQITKRKGSGYLAKLAAQMVIQSGIPYEFRTTVHPNLLSEDDLQEIAKELCHMGATSYVLQRFRTEGCIDEELIKNALTSPFSSELEKSLQTQFTSFVAR